MIIYKITNLINNKIYIGQYSGNDKHYLGGGRILQLAQKKYGRKNFKKEIIIANITNQNLLNELEKHYIRLYNSQNRKIGYNIQSGGKNPGKISEETKLKIAKSNTGKIVSLETRLKQRLSQLGKKQPLEQIKKKIESRKWYKHSEETKKKIAKSNSIPVVQYTLDFIFIKEYPSLMEASRQTGINFRNIFTAIKKNTIEKPRSSGGYRWKYKKDIL